jgi:hypothetical protein
MLRTIMGSALLATGVLALAQPGTAAAQNAAYGASYIQPGAEEFYTKASRALHENRTVSPRARAMGGSYAALANGASGVVENPAALGAQTDREAILDLGFTDVEGDGESMDIVSINVGGAFNINARNPHYWPRDNVGNHTWGVVYHRADVTVSSTDTVEGDIQGITLAYGRSFRGGRYFGGLAFDYTRGDITGDDFFTRIWDRWSVRAGGIVRPVERLALGAVIELGGLSGGRDDRPFDTPSKSTAWEFRSGASYEVSDMLLLVGDIGYRKIQQEQREGGLQLEEHSIWRYSAGLEASVVPDTLALRGGLYYLHDSFNVENLLMGDTVDDVVGVTAGGSYYLDGFDFGYTLDADFDGDWSHLFRIEYDW